MPRFFEIAFNEHGINLDHVRRIVKTEDGYEFLDAEDRVFAKQKTEAYEDWSKLAAPVVPAAPDARGYVIYYDNDDGTETTRDDLHAECLPIVAWRITDRDEMGFGPEPVFLDPPASNGIPLIIFPDGKLCEPGSGTYDDLDHAMTTILARLNNRQRKA
jgi:hypothetical protein